MSFSGKPLIAFLRGPGVIESLKQETGNGVMAQSGNSHTGLLGIPFVVQVTYLIIYH